MASSGVEPSYIKRSCVHGEAQSGKTKHILVVNIGWHTGLMLLTEEAKGMVPLPEIENNSHIELGWGDGEFYRASGYSYWKGFRALFFAGDAVIQTAGFRADVQDFLNHSQVIELTISDDGYGTFLELVRDALVYDDSGRPKPMGGSLYGNGHFYEAKGHTSLCRTCNTWNAEALRAAGCEIPASLIRSSALMRELEKLPIPPISAGEAPR